MLLDEPVVPSAPLISSGMPLRANQRLSLQRNATIRNAICMRLCILRRRQYVRPISNLREIRGNSTVLVQLGGLEPPTSCSTDSFFLWTLPSYNRRSEDHSTLFL